MKKETVVKIIEAVKVILTIVAGFFGGAATASAAAFLSMY